MYIGGCEAGAGALPDDRAFELGERHRSPQYVLQALRGLFGLK
jgi:hypothetical protein